MPQFWTTPPTFAQGQPLSAGAHLNSLATAIQVLLDDTLGFQLPFSGFETVPVWDWAIEWTGAIRHRYDRLDWAYQIMNSTSAKITINGGDVPGTSNSGAGTYSGQADLSGLGLAAGEFYEIAVDTGADARVRPWLLAETVDLSYPSLAAFADESTPTAAQWQALSDYADVLADELNHPYAPVMRTRRTSGNMFTGTMYHRCQYLAYEIAIQAPYYRSDYPALSGDRYTEAHVYLDGTEVARFRVGDDWGAGPGLPVQEQYVGGASVSHVFSGQIDLDTCGVPLVLGATYTIHIEITRTGVWGDLGWGRLYKLAEIPAAAPALAGWVALPTWAHGDYVYGDSTAKQVATLKTDLELLQAVATYHNIPCVSQRAGDDWRFYMRRRYRWLHYRNAAGESPKIGYDYAGETQEASLPDAESAWQVYDLESAEGLWPGTEYLLAGVTYALEDVEP